MGKHSLKVHIAPEIARDPGVVGAKTITMRERILRRLFGPRHKVTIIVPGESVDRIDITEREKADDDGLMALAEAVGITGEGGER